MSQPPDLGTLHLEDNDYADQDEVFDSPEHTRNVNGDGFDRAHGRSTSRPHNNTRQEHSEDRQAALQKELESVRGMNRAIEGVLDSLERAKANMGTVNTTVQNASTLLNTWTRILSQTEHNQRLILNPSWQGATQDLEDIENEAIMRQQAAERRAAEDQARREATARRAAEEEARKTTAPTSTRGARGRGRGPPSSRLTGTSRTPAPSSSNYVGVGGQGGRGRANPRAGSGIGRGTARGTRGRGVG